MEASDKISSINQERFEVGESMQQTIGLSGDSVFGFLGGDRVINQHLFADRRGIYLGKSFN